MHPNEINQSQKNNTERCFLYEVSTAVKFMETESRMVGASGWTGRNEGVYFSFLNGCEVLVLEDEKNPEMVIGGDCYISVNVFNVTEPHT